MNFMLSDLIPHLLSAIREPAVIIIILIAGLFFKKTIFAFMFALLASLIWTVVWVFYIAPEIYPGGRADLISMAVHVAVSAVLATILNLIKKLIIRPKTKEDKMNERLLQATLPVLNKINYETAALQASGLKNYKLDEFEEELMLVYRQLNTKDKAKILLDIQKMLEMPGEKDRSPIELSDL